MSVFSSDIGGAATVDFGGGGGGFAGGPAPAGATNIGGLNRAFYGTGGGLAKPINGPGYKVGVGPRPVRPQQTTGQIFGRSGEVFGRSAAISGRSATTARPALGGLGRVARTTLPGGSPNPNSGQGVRLPQVPSALPTARAPAGGLPGNPFAQPPQPFTPSGAGDLPIPQYPNQLPPSAIPDGPIVEPAYPGAPDPDAGGDYTAYGGVRIDYYNHGQDRRLTVNVRKYEIRKVGTTTYIDLTNCSGNVTSAIIASPGNELRPINIQAGQACGSGLPLPTGPYIPPTRSPNRSRNPNPQPLPSATPAPARAPSPRPWPQLPRPRQPAKQPLPPTAPLPNLPRTAPLPDELAPPSTAPAPATTPTGQPVTLPSGVPTGGSVAIGVPGGQLSGGRRIAPLSPGAAPLNPVRPAPVAAPGQVPVQLTSGQAQPVFTPVQNFTTQQGITPAIEVLPEPVFNKPPTKTEDCTPDPDAKCRYDNQGIAGKCDKIQDLLDANLEINYFGEIVLPPCDEGGESQTFSANDKGLPGIDEKLDIIAQALTQVWNRVKCDQDAVAVIPEWWQVRAGANRPQLVILYAEQLQNGKLGQSRWSITIPWFREDMRGQLASSLPAYTKGQWQGMTVLSDNSKIIVYAVSQPEAENTINQLLTFVQPQMVDNTTVYLGQRKGANLKQAYVVPTIAHYYPTGQQTNAPAWSEKLR